MMKKIIKYTAILLIIIIILIAIVFAVHKIYPVDKENEQELISTNIGAGELLIFIGSYFTLIGTIFLGWVSLKLNRRLLNLEERKGIPSIKISEKGESMCLNEKELNFQLMIFNNSYSPIKILEVDDLKFTTFGDKYDMKVDFTKSWNKGIVILSNSNMMLDFYSSNNSDYANLFIDFDSGKLKILTIQCLLEICFKVADKSSERYIEKIYFTIYCKKNDREFELQSIEYDFEANTN